MTRRPFRFRPALVEREIEDAARWYVEQKDLQLGLDFYDAVLEKINEIRDQPRAYRRWWRDVRRANLTRFPYHILFYEEDDAIVVMAVVHDARHPARSHWRRDTDSRGREG